MSDELLITPESVKDYTYLGRKRTVTISKTMISFNKAAVIALSRKKGDTFALKLIDNKLYYVDSNDGFTIQGITKPGSLNAYTSGLLPFLKKQGIIDPGASNQKFELGEFKDGRRLLSLIGKKTA